MASTYQTPFLKLNKWTGDDKPKKDDFNTDNQLIDECLSNHLSPNTLHITPEDRAKWNANSVVCGTYTGDGATARTINLGFAPTYGVVYAVDKSGMQLELISGGSAIKTTIRQGSFSKNGSSIGLVCTATGFTVREILSGSDNVSPRLNTQSFVYAYVAFA